MKKTNNKEVLKKQFGFEDVISIQKELYKAKNAKSKKQNNSEKLKNEIRQLL